MSKVFCLLYNYSDGANQEINDPDWDIFLTEVTKKNPKKVLCIPHRIKKSTEIVERIEGYTANQDVSEVYLHFSSHGLDTAINFGEWDINITDFVNILSHHKIKFCFFSACSSLDIARAVSKHVPVTIGSSYKLGTHFAIRFQREFYKLLFEQKHPFRVAFDQTITQLNKDVKLNEVIKKNGLQDLDKSTLGDREDMNDEPRDDLHILYRNDRCLENYLLKPELVSALHSRSAGQDLLIHWTDNPNFGPIDTIYERFTDNQIQSYSLTDSQLKELTQKEVLEELAIIDEFHIKFCFYLSGHNFPGKLESVLGESTFTDHDRFDFRIFLVQNPNEKFVYPPDIQENLTNIQRPSRIFDSLSELMQDKLFLDFIRPELNLSAGKDLLLELPFKPSKKPVRDPNKERIHLMLINPKNEIVIEYLINYGKKKSKNYRPVVIVDAERSAQADLLQAVKEAIQQMTNLNHSLVGMLEYLITHPYIVFIRMGNLEKEKVKEFINRLTDVFTKSVNRYLDGLDGGPPDTFKPVLFFMSTARLDASDFQDINRTETSIISNPNDLDKAIIEDWSERYEGDDIYAKWKNAIDDFDFEKHENKCPTQLLVHACEKLGVFQGQITKVS